MKCKFFAVLAISTALFSCDDQTEGIGQSVAEKDKIEAFSDSYPIDTRTDLLNSVYSRSSIAYLGKYTDELFGEFSAEFLTQINCPEEFIFPETTFDFTEVTLDLYYSEYFGDSLATMRVQIDTLDTVIKDDGSDPKLYYTNFDPSQYYDESVPHLAIKDYAAYDKSVSDSLQSTSGYLPRVSIDLGKNFAQHLLTAYDKDAKTHPNFADAEAFINNVLKGFYVHVTSGEGSVLYIEDIYLNITAAYMAESSSGEVDSVAYTVVPMAASKEVFMSTNFQNKDLESLKEDISDGTYLKTPAGLYTEVTLGALEDIYREHKTDTLNAINITFPKYRDISNGQYKMGTPSNLLLVRKSEMYSFFEEGQVPDTQTSFLSSYDSSSNAYTFNSLNRLVRTIFSEIGPEIDKGEDAWNQWKQDNPDWNKVVLIPVTLETDSQGSTIGVENDLSVNAAKLYGVAEDAPESEKIQMEVIFTHPEIK